MRGLEPPPGFPDTDLNRARLPIPPHPRAVGAKISHRDSSSNAARAGSARAPIVSLRLSISTRLARGALLASVELCAPPSSRGLGRRPLTAVTRVRIPLAVCRLKAQVVEPASPVFWKFLGVRLVGRWIRARLCRGMFGFEPRVVVETPGLARERRRDLRPSCSETPTTSFRSAPLRVHVRFC
jgi:hypothetical protein